MATTRSVPQGIPHFWIDCKMYALDTSQTVPLGTFACNVAGKVQAATDTLIQGGATFLGTAAGNYANPDPTNAQVGMYNFMRGYGAWVPNGKSGDAPTAVNVGGPVYLSDNNTIKVTKTTGDQAFTLLEVCPGGGYRVLI